MPVTLLWLHLFEVDLLFIGRAGGNEKRISSRTPFPLG
nr:MAG TPA: hypothetical protein [Caudoviricetes sp.]